MKRFIKIVPNEFRNESRDMRELSTAAEMGFDTVVIAKGEQNATVKANGWDIHYIATRPLGTSRYLTHFNRVVSAFLWAYEARKLKADCISCHDLIALYIGWISAWFIKKGARPKLVYDSHEFEAGRNSSRGKLANWAMIRAEHFLIRKCDLCIVVNDSIADEMQKLHSLDKRPVAIRNIPDHWNIDEAECFEQRGRFCEALNLDHNTFFIMYHGAIMENRGIEYFLRSIKNVDDVAAIILGNGESQYIEELKRLIVNLEIENRVLFQNAVPLSILWKYAGAVDLGMVTIQPTCRSYYLSLPNKLFEYIQSGTPVLTSDFPELKKILNQYQIGIYCNPENTEEISKGILKLKNDAVLYSELKQKVLMAKDELCWENERTILVKTYQALFNE